MFNLYPLYDKTPFGIIILEKHEITFINKWVTERFYITDNFCKNQNEYIHEEDISNEMECNAKFFYNNVEIDSICRLKNKNNNYTWIKICRKIIQESYVFIIEDINELKKMEIKLKNESIKAENEYHHKSTFLANMSHEIRTPLNGIIGMINLLEDTGLNEEQNDFLLMIKECSFNLMTIINDILDYSKLEVGKINLDYKPFNLQECIESTNDIITSKIYEKSLEYTYNIKSSVPDCIITDSNRLKQILLNLLTNAIKFTDKGVVSLSISTIKKEEFKKECTNEDHVFIRFDISDTGCGIKEQEREKLFKSFSQIDNQVSTKIYQGTGLGLAICKELVDLMGGYVWLDWSEPNKGSIFSFVIPVQETTDSYCFLGGNDQILKSKNVLIVDDNLQNRLTLTRLVNRWGMRSSVFSTSEEALYSIKFTDYDIGLIDICMPKINGVAFASKLQEQGKTFPLIGLSSLGDKINNSSSLFKGYLIKPVKESKLRNLCIQCLQEYSHNDSKKCPPLIDNYIIENNAYDLKSDIKILLAEDVYINQRVVISFLNKMGFTNIDVVDNGRDCLEHLHKNRYDIAFLDIKMPIYNGDEVLKSFLKDFKNKKPWFIAITAYCLQDDREHYLKIGFDDYIAKPISINDLSICVNKCLQKLLIE